MDKNKLYIMEYYAAIKNIILPFTTTWMNLEGIMLSKISQTRANTYDYTYIWNLKHKQTKQNKKLLVTETKGMVARGKGMESLMKKVKWNIVNNIVISLHGDWWLLE